MNEYYGNLVRRTSGIAMTTHVSVAAGSLKIPLLDSPRYDTPVGTSTNLEVLTFM